MKILVLNSGSSSVKFQIIETDLERMNAHEDLTLAVGLVEKIGLSDSRLLLEVPDRKPYQDYREILEHRTAIEWVLRILVDPENGILESVDEIEAVGHRVVHGGEAFASSVLITLNSGGTAKATPPISWATQPSGAMVTSCAWPGTVPRATDSTNATGAATGNARQLPKMLIISDFLLQ